MADRRQRANKEISARALERGVTERLVKLLLGMTATLYRWVRLLQTLEVHDPFRARASLQALLLANNLLTIINNARPERPSAVKRKQRKMLPLDGKDRGSGGLPVGTLRMKKNSLELKVMSTLRMATELHFHVPGDARESIEEEINSLMDEMNATPTATEGVVVLEAVLEALRDQLRLGLNEYFGKFLQMYYNPTDEQENEVAKGPVERWDILEDELLEMERVMHRHDDFMKERGVKKYSLKKDDYMNAVKDLLEEEDVKNLDPFERKRVKNKQRKGGYSGRTGRNQRPQKARNRAEELALLEELYGGDDEGRDSDEEKEEEPCFFVVACRVKI